MRDKIEFLVDETSASHEEAELALSLAQYNVEEALRILHAKHHDILVIKSKFYNPSPRLYGLMLLIANLAGSKKNPFFRIRFVITDNPSVYESSLDAEWYEFEKEIYHARLSEWSYVNLSQNMEKEWERLIADSSESLRYIGSLVEQGDRTILTSWFESLMVSSTVFRQRLKFSWKADIMNLRDFQQTPFTSDGVPLSSFPENKPAPAAMPCASTSFSGDHIFLSLRVALADQVVESMADGVQKVAVSELRPGDTVFVYVLETRDSAVYLAQLFGGTTEQGLAAIEVPVESIWEEEELVGVRVRFGHTAVGEGTYPKNLKISVIPQEGTFLSPVNSERRSIE